MDNMYVNEKNGNVSFNNAQIARGRWSNFSGGPTDWDPKNTKRWFTIFLPDDEAQRLTDLGWNVRTRNSTNESEPELKYLKIAMNYDPEMPWSHPRIWLVRRVGNPELLEAEDLFQLDNKDLVIIKASIQIRPHDWKLANGTSGRKAWLKQMYVSIEQDDFGAEYWNRGDDEALPFGD